MREDLRPAPDSDAMPSAMMILRCCILAISIPLAIAAVPGMIAAAPQPDGGVDRADAHFRRVLENVRQARLGEALGETDRLIARFPNFRLAHLVRGDLLLARSRPIAGFGNTGHAANGRLDELRTEASVRLRAISERPPADSVPRYLLRFDPRQRHAIVIDASRSRVYVFENANGTPRHADDFYGTLGKSGIDKQREGDRKTPIGVYNVVSQIPGSKLPDLYGWGAFPINYPNEWDRIRGKTGFGIWLHGVPSDTYARAPQASDGCIALANPDIAVLANRVQVGATPVIIAERIEWIAPQVLRTERDSFARQLEEWIADWESLDAARYLAHYARDFRSGGMDLAAWREHKRRVNATKSWIKVSLLNLSVFRAPGAPGVIAVTFDQDYRSSNLAQKTRKRQYWVEEDGRWKIAYEAPVAAAILAMPESFPNASR